VLDRDGKNAALGQPHENVMFLAGKLAEKDRSFPNRFCTIFNEKSILFPIINCECNQLEHPELRTQQDIIDRVKMEEDTIVKKECFVNGKGIAPERVKSDPLVFELSLVTDNLFDVKAGKTYASSDGYWVFLKPLPVGKYVISFNGACENGRLNSGANYYIEVL
jgi:hypothetical protein